MPSCGKAAASTALPQPPKTNQNVPMNSATERLARDMGRSPSDSSAHPALPGRLPACLLLKEWMDPQRTLRLPISAGPGTLNLSFPTDLRRLDGAVGAAGGGRGAARRTAG